MPDDDTGGGSAFEALVDKKLLDLQATQEARKIFDQEGQEERPPFKVKRLSQIVREGKPVQRVDGLIPANASTLIVAQRKAGKTTAILNLTHSLLSGEAFLGRKVIPVKEGNRVGILNFEVNEEVFQDWAIDLKIDLDRVAHSFLRDDRNPFNSEQDMEDLAKQLRDENVEVLIVDPFSAAFKGDQNSNSETRAWLTRLNHFTRGDGGVGATDLILCAHAGHAQFGQKTCVRGASSIEDWPDSIITISLNESTGQRSLGARGRDVDVPDHNISMDPDTRKLSAEEEMDMFEKIADDVASLPLIVDFIRKKPGLNVTQLRKKVYEESAKWKADGKIARRPTMAEINSLLLTAESQRMIEVHSKGKAKLHYVKGAQDAESDTHVNTHVNTGM